MKQNTIRIGAAALAVLLTTAAGVTYTLAQGTGEADGFHKRGDMKEKHQEVKQAIESGDFAAFQEAVGDHEKFIDKVTEENFDRFVEAHQLMKDGDKEGAKEIFDELGFEKKPFHHKHKRGEKRTSEQRAAIDTALESGDYQAFVDAVGEDGKMLEHVTQDNFDRFVEAHQLRVDGNHEEARTIMGELGFDKRPGKFHGNKRGGKTQR